MEIVSVALFGLANGANGENRYHNVGIRDSGPLLLSFFPLQLPLSAWLLGAAQARLPILFVTSLPLKHPCTSGEGSRRSSEAQASDWSRNVPPPTLAQPNVDLHALNRP